MRFYEEKLVRRDAAFVNVALPPHLETRSRATRPERVGPGGRWPHVPRAQTAARAHARRFVAASAHPVRGAGAAAVLAPPLLCARTIAQTPSGRPLADRVPLRAALAPQAAGEPAQLALHALHRRRRREWRRRAARRARYQVGWPLRACRHGWPCPRAACRALALSQPAPPHSLKLWGIGRARRVQA